MFSFCIFFLHFFWTWGTELDGKFFLTYEKYYNCHGTTCIITGTNHLHPLTITWVLITNTCNHLPLPFISSLTSVTHRLVSRLHSSLHWSMSAYLPIHPGSHPCLRKRKFTYSDTVHPASRAFFVISPMLEALPELFWINHLLTCICLSVSLTSLWQKTSPKSKIEDSMDDHGRILRESLLPPPPYQKPVPWPVPQASSVRRSPAMGFCYNAPYTLNYSPISLRRNGQNWHSSSLFWMEEPCSGWRHCGVRIARGLTHWKTSLNISVKYSASRLLRSLCMMSCSSYGKLIHQFTYTRFVFVPSLLAAVGTRLPCVLPIAEAWTPLYVSRCPSTTTPWGLRASSKKRRVSLNA